jgi:hypothetical protein
LFGVSLASIHSAFKTNELRELLTERGISGAREFPTATLSALNALRNSEDVMVDAAKAVSDLGMTSIMTKELIDVVKSRRNDKGKLEAIDGYASKLEGERLKTKKEKKIPGDSVSYLLKRLNGLLTISPNMKKLGYYSESQKNTFRTLCGLVIEALEKAKR